MGERNYGQSEGRRIRIKRPLSAANDMRLIISLCYDYDMHGQNKLCMEKRPVSQTITTEGIPAEKLRTLITAINNNFLARIFNNRFT